MNKYIKKEQDKSKLIAELQLLVTQNPDKAEWEAGKKLILMRYFPNAKENMKEEFEALAECMVTAYWNSLAFAESVKDYKSEHEEIMAKVRKYNKQAKADGKN